MFASPLSGDQEAGNHLPAQSIQDAPEQGKDNERAGCHALDMAAFGFNIFCGNRILPKDETPWKILRATCSSIVLAGTDALSGT
jgi:hypothetical protein